MTVFDSGYKRFEYEPTSVLTRVRALATAEFGKIFKTKKGVILFVFCVVYAVVLLVLVHIFSTSIEMLPPRMSPFKSRFYLGHSMEEGVVTLLMITSIISVRSIAGDRSTNALEILWTRGISPWQYFLGKWAGSFVLLSLVFVAGPILAWLYGWLSAPDGKFFDATSGFIPAIALALVVKCFLVSFFAVAVSGIVASPNAATFIWLLFNFGSMAVVAVLTLLARLASKVATEDVIDFRWFDALAPWKAMLRIDHHLTGIPSTNEYPVWIAWASLAVFATFLLYRLQRSLRTTEAMA